MVTSYISIWLDNYDDLFSDFDPRPYSERVLSDDFLTEVKKVCREKEATINELKLLLPAAKRNEEIETIIIKRLQLYFKKNYQQHKQQYKARRKKGMICLLIDMVLMLSASYLSSLHSPHFLLNALFVILEPSGWFLVWFGLDHVFYISKQGKPDLEFFKVIAKSKITFSSIT